MRGNQLDRGHRIAVIASSPRVIQWFCYAILLFAPLIVYWNVLVGSETLSLNAQSILHTNTVIRPVADPEAGAQQDEPWLYFIRRNLLAGRLPVANLDNALGESFVESLQTGVFYPPNLLLPLLPADSSQFFDIFQSLHLVLLLFGLYACARCYLPRLESTFVALCIALSGGIFLNINMVHYRAFAWLPVMCFGAISLAQGRTRRGIIALSCGIACSMTAGNPQETVLHLFTCSVLYIAERLRSKHLSIRSDLFFAGTMFSGLLMSAPGLVPFLAAQKAGELFSVGDASRALETVNPEWMAAWIFPKLNGLFPYVMFPPPYPTPQADGIPAVWVLACAGATLLAFKNFASMRERLGYLLIALIVVLGLLKVMHLQAFNFFGVIPFVKGIKFHKYHLYLVVLMGALGILGLHYLLQASQPVRRRALLVGLGVYVVAVAGVISALFMTGDVTLGEQQLSPELLTVWFSNILVVAFLLWALWTPKPARWMIACCAVIALSAAARPPGFFRQRETYKPFAENMSQWRDQIAHGRIASGILANSNHFYGYETISTFNPIGNLYYVQFMGKHLRPISQAFHQQPAPNIPLSAAELDALRMIGTTSIHNYKTEPANSLRKFTQGGRYLDRTIPKAFLLNTHDAEELDRSCANWHPTDVVNFLNDGRMIPVSVQRSGNHSLALRTDAPFSGKLVLNYAASKSWRFQGQEAAPLCNLWASFNVENFTSGVATRWPLGLSVAICMSVAGVLCVIALLLVDAVLVRRNNRDRPYFASPEGRAK